MLLTSINPINGKPLGSVRMATKKDVEETVAMARRKLKGWRSLTLKKRAAILVKLAGLLRKNQEKLAELISQEMGKPLTEAADEVESTAEYVDYFVKEGLKVLADESLFKRKTGVSLIRYDPVGVVAVIKAWNFPVKVPLWSIVPALLAGNTVVYKPSEYVPLVSQELVKLIFSAGVPREAFGVVYGRGKVGEMLVEQDIDMISFTGSTKVGKDIAQKASGRLVKLVLELGGSSPALVLKDADLDLAAERIVWSRFRNCGQVCGAIKRVYVEEAVADKFIAKVVEKVKALRVGDPLDKKTAMGPLVSERQLRRFQDQVTRGVVAGGRIISGGRRIRKGKLAEGWFHEPTVMVYVSNKNPVMQEEVFGPLLPVMRVVSFSAGLTFANDNPYGLTAAVFTRSKLKANRAVETLVAGSVYVNEAGFLSPESPWSGLKNSGLGVENSRHGLLEFVHKRHVYFRG
ncbi:MAG: Betaine-aldehyde dehydrogenase [Candidatus Beckwithbacteria bacterium GW2011_GWB1_47_15]|uniref:Aldehyde dehydrogenase n=1 Tax=Candidatus Beckwithbacteria bacterium GW2011_GWB1_47_15 TaxID=1618371 RepID=A0A0G1RWJ5_9BACT|nr:MAG: aldehyde dehydrogenase [Candidatus Beckwithbacteria bacterium GW2011_GWC1_49_16]KKU35210.1 MAG: Betaine-aldehyde dehydrogenase [Candidatus Beckwithbacteria bacterium GW2011_GWA1_46_30]KKU61512.1 MAG: Betaine-aldehyde dehydrogenase [Candidatus Beckwithbacteria bacterium GW2011_GWB1_47_15]KKU71716.1 MAG: Betaine-aldehyde dehydrogenase [Candidatus Beckwithbacteria bacterium GW2011_GWA2_47_25]KKW03814.1 MAG: Betaine-aldehyde dehydrogenase [Candidatus Beckwithbacteria bacterium GW2011_GWC2_4